MAFSRNNGSINLCWSLSRALGFEIQFRLRLYELDYNCNSCLGYYSKVSFESHWTHNCALLINLTCMNAFLLNIYKFHWSRMVLLGDCWLGPRFFMLQLTLYNFVCSLKHTVGSRFSQNSLIDNWVLCYYPQYQ